MGARDRRDPAGHKQRGKGVPTPEHIPGQVNGSKITPEQAAAHAAKVARAAGSAPPPVHFVGFAEGLSAAPGQHPHVADALLDLTFFVGNGGMATIRFPAHVWPALREVADEAYALAVEGEPTDSGLVLGGDVASEAKAAEARADAERRARGEQP